MPMVSSLEHPQITVLMSVYNGEKFLRKAVDSILDQTYKNFEFLIINDFSTDSSRDIILSYNDPRIKLIDNEKNIGLTRSLNKGIGLAQGEYIARMDCDDISLPERLAKQITFMDSNPEVGVCGTWAKIIGESEDIWRYPTDADTIRCSLLFGSVLVHSSVIIRRKFFKLHNLSYNEQLQQSQDYDLWVRCAQLFPLRNIAEILLLYRLHDQQVGNVFSNNQKEGANTVRQQQLISLGVTFGTSEFLVHEHLSYNDSESNHECIDKAQAWLLKLLNANKKTDCFPHQAFENLLAERWRMVCWLATSLGLWVWRRFWRSPLTALINLNQRQKAKYFIKCLIKYKPKNE
jgi:glycosyltransferase involved in cell wall biosynthesis